ncbi:hypothetical protein [Burkholderia sp. BCC1988]|uniref:hypothetical protein n=1 Tax=Burkholderia sp. BCC1988 TaxID=2817443 RepID=UPI002AB0DC97|nr:hypothetical protein [Burkholderia sp. BCC1988]
MQRDVLQAACRPDCPDAPRAARISFQTGALAVTCNTVRAAGRNRTTPRIADRLNGSSHARLDRPIHASSRASRHAASVRRQASAIRDRAPFGSRSEPYAHPGQSRFRTRIPSRGYDACRTLHPVFDRALHPAPCRATRAIPTRPTTLVERVRAA